MKSGKCANICGACRADELCVAIECLHVVAGQEITGYDVHKLDDRWGHALLLRRLKHLLHFAANFRDLLLGLLRHVLEPP